MGIRLRPHARLRRVPEVDPIHAERLREISERLAVVRDAEALVRAELVEAARAAHEAGMTVYRIAQVTGVSQPGVRKWLDS